MYISVVAFHIIDFSKVFMEIKSSKIEKSRIVVEGGSFSAYYEQAVQAIIRPPKNTYTKDSLGPNPFSLAGGRSYQRID